MAIHNDALGALASSNKVPHQRDEHHHWHHEKQRGHHPQQMQTQSEDLLIPVSPLTDPNLRPREARSPSPLLGNSVSRLMTPGLKDQRVLSRTSQTSSQSSSPYLQGALEAVEPVSDKPPYLRLALPPHSDKPHQLRSAAEAEVTRFYEIFR